MANGDKKKQIKAYMKEAKRDIRGKAPKDAKSLASYQVEKGTGPFTKKFVRKGTQSLYQGGKPQLRKDQAADIEFASTKKGRRLAKIEQRVTARNIRKAKRKGTYNPELGDPTAKYTPGGVERRVDQDRKYEQYHKKRRTDDLTKLYMKQDRTDEYGTRSGEGRGKYFLEQPIDKEAQESSFKTKQYKKIKEASNR